MDGHGGRWAGGGLGGWGVVKVDRWVGGSGRRVGGWVDGWAGG